MSTPREVDLGSPVLAYLEERGFDCYQEVRGPVGVADVIGIQASLVVVVEMKTSLSLQVIAQADRWSRWANYTYAAVPTPKRADDGNNFAHRILRDHGIGLLVIGKHGAVHVAVAPALRRQDASHLRSIVRPEHKTFSAAGSAGGGNWSVFKDSCARVAAHVANHPGLTLRELFDAVGELHWSSKTAARSSLLHWIEKGSVPGLRIDRTGKVARVFLAARSEVA